MDIRRRRTRIRLHRALCDLLAEQPLSAISVEALTAKARVTRPTFYSNYAALTDMLDEYLEGLLVEVEARMEAMMDGGGATDCLEGMGRFSASVFSEIDRNDPRLIALFQGVPNLAPEPRFAAVVERIMVRADVPDHKVWSAEARRFKAHFFTGAFIGALRYWVQSPPGIDPYAMGRAFSDFALNGRLGAAPPFDEST
ncbi:DNA-binding transcriptional regulator, AcrR family [Poseidonocella pacifica]|uniref:DNA-binding transcriptional regulator, AcrR family n=1 Tax=Poseidonocella pacifica TaxID=871651 RepID=A0A1I0WQK3_9RHOB|nr:TetR/AcrR family transcriptional regulator [Poseidonocella pacifica]SFA90824.1 DNA-binding transcriptional regulator, AcrR family [Poseidonocella pacifica]